MKFFTNSIVNSFFPFVQIVLYFLVDNNSYGNFIFLIAIYQLFLVLFTLRFESSMTIYNHSLFLDTWFSFYSNAIKFYFVPFYLVLFFLFDFSLGNSLIIYFSIILYAGYSFFIYFQLFNHYSLMLLLKSIVPIFILFLYFIFDFELQQSLIVAVLASFCIGIITLSERLHFRYLGQLNFGSFIGAINNRKEVVFSTFLDNLGLYMPTLIIGNFFNKVDLAEYSIFTKLLFIPQVFLSLSISNFIQLNYHKILAFRNKRKILLIVFVSIFIYISTYILLYNIYALYFQGKMSKNIFPYPIYLTFLMVLYFSFRLVVNPTSIILFLKNDFQTLKNCQFVLLGCEMLSLFLLIFLKIKFLDYIIINTIIGTFGYLFYLSKVVRKYYEVGES